MRWVTTALAAALALSLGEVRAVAQCRPACSLHGDPTLVSAIRPVLSRHGVQSEPVPGCPALGAHVDEADGWIQLTVDDPSGNRSTVRVHDAMTAATYIESWLLTAVSDPLLAGTQYRAEPTIVEEPGPSAPPVATREAASLRGYSVGFGVDGLTGADASFWVAPEVMGCFFVGAVCLGALVRGSVDTGLSGDSNDLDSVRRGLDVFVLAELPFRIGRVVGVPGLGFGSGWLQSRPNGEGADGDMVNVDSGGLRITGRFDVRIPTSESLALQLGAHAIWSPFAHSSPYNEEGLLISGEPSWSVGVGAGLRFGGP